MKVFKGKNPVCVSVAELVSTLEFPSHFLGFLIENQNISLAVSRDYMVLMKAVL